MVVAGVVLLLLHECTDGWNCDDEKNFFHTKKSQDEIFLTFLIGFLEMLLSFFQCIFVLFKNY